MILLFNKPYGVLSQFTDDGGRPTLAPFIPIKRVYAAGRLDFDSEGLLVLTDDGRVQHALAGERKTYWVQVDGAVTDAALSRLRRGVDLKDGRTAPADARALEPPDLWPRTPPVRVRQQIPTSWLALTIGEGRNRQVRRMTAAVGFPTLRLVRVSVGPFALGALAPGAWSEAPPAASDLM